MDARGCHTQFAPQPQRESDAGVDFDAFDSSLQSSAAKTQICPGDTSCARFCAALDYLRDQTAHRAHCANGLASLDGGDTEWWCTWHLVLAQMAARACLASRSIFGGQVVTRRTSRGAGGVGARPDQCFRANVKSVIDNRLIAALGNRYQVECELGAGLNN
jgi:hypothetical protein